MAQGFVRWQTWPMMDLSWPPDGSKLAQDGSNLASRCFHDGLILPHGPPMMALLGPPWPFMGGPRGHLEAIFTVLMPSSPSCKLSSAPR